MLCLPHGLSPRAESGFLAAPEEPSEHTEAVARLGICPFSALQTHGCGDGDCGELVSAGPHQQDLGVMGKGTAVLGVMGS